MKRKTKEQIAGGMNDIQVVVDALDDAIAFAEAQVQPNQGENRNKIEREILHEQPISKRSKPSGKIGEGKGAPLNKAQRKRML